LRKRANVFTEEFLSACDILDVSDDAGLSIGGQHFEEAFFPINLLEDDQTLPCFTAVVGLLLVFPQEEEFEFLGAQFKNGRNRELRRFVVLRHEWLF